MMTDFEKTANEAYFLSLFAYLKPDLIQISRKDGLKSSIPGLNEYLDYKEKIKSTKKGIRRSISSFHPDVTMRDILGIENIYGRDYVTAEYAGIDNEEDFKKIIELIIENPDYRNIKLNDMSYCLAGYSKDTLDGLCFEKDNKLYIVFRGTGAGKWMDNGVGLCQTSEMQVQAAKFYTEMVKKYGKDKEIIVTGHSKGGNLAQAAVLLSPEGNAVGKVISFDGQGFSQSLIDEYRTEPGKQVKDLRPQITKVLPRMYSICDKNDFVNPLGIGLFPKENVFYINSITPEGKFSNPHDLKRLSGILSKINFTKNNEGEIVSATPGLINKLTTFLSKKLMLLDNDTQKHICLAGMGIAQGLLQGNVGVLLQSGIGGDAIPTGLLTLIKSNKVQNILNHMGYKDYDSAQIAYGSGSVIKPSQKDMSVFVEKGIPFIFDTIKEAMDEKIINRNELIQMLGSSLQKHPELLKHGLVKKYVKNATLFLLNDEKGADRIIKDAQRLSRFILPFANLAKIEEQKIDSYPLDKVVRDLSHMEKYNVGIIDFIIRNRTYSKTITIETQEKAHIDRLVEIATKLKEEYGIKSNKEETVHKGRNDDNRDNL